MRSRGISQRRPIVHLVDLHAPVRLYFLRVRTVLSTNQFGKPADVQIGMIAIAVVIQIAEVTGCRAFFNPFADGEFRRRQVARIFRDR